MLTNLMWQAFAKIAAIPLVANYLITRSFRTPYFNLEGYMDRWWLFNGYGNDVDAPEAERHERRKYKWLPSVRIHHILRADVADHMHDHPWDARTIILKGWYREYRGMWDTSDMTNTLIPMYFLRQRGDTAGLKYGEYHEIAEVPHEGVWTMFFTWDYKGGWGFLVNGVKVPWRTYVADGGRNG